MRKLNLKNKLIILLQIPIFGLIFLSLTISYDRYIIYTKLDMLNKVIIMTIKTKSLIYSLQKERGFSNGFIGDDSEYFKIKLLNQINETNIKKQEVTAYLKNIDINYYGNKFKTSITKALDDLDKIDTTRDKIIKMKINQINEHKVNENYTNTINSFIKIITYTLFFSNNTSLSQSLNAHVNLTYAIEKTANERGLGTLAFSSKKFSFEMKNKLNILVAEQNVYFKNFLRNLDEHNLNFYKDMYKGRTIRESLRMRNTILKSIEKKIIISQINNVIGLGGIFQNQYNYLKTDNNLYLQKIKEQYKELYYLLNKYNKLAFLSQEEKNLIIKIKKIFKKYNENLNEINTSNKNSLHNFNITSTDIIVKALNDLTNKNFFNDNSSYWFNTMTEKISLLQDIDNNLIKKIKENTTKISKDAKFDMNLYMFLCLTIILIVFILGKNISTNIVNSVDELLKGINIFFKFINKKTKKIKLINIKSNDEIGEISKIINEKMLISKKILDEDIIERAKQLEIEVNKKTKDLEITNKEYKFLLDKFNTHVLASRTNINGVITFATDRFCKVSGYTKEELIGKNHSLLRHPAIPKSLYKKMWDTIQYGEKFVNELKNVRKNGSTYWVKITIVPEFDEKMNIIGYFSVKEIIDDKIKIREFNNQLEKKISKAIEESRKKDELLSYQSKLATMGEMIGIIAHQWKQPLSSLSMKIQGMKYKKKLDDQYKDLFISDNMELINFMTKTIDDFRDFYRHDKKKEDFEVAKCIHKTLNIVKPQLVESKIELNVEGIELIINGLQSEFQHVILNLISNAKDVLIEKKIKNKKINILTKIENNKGIITVEDNAGGIPEEIIENVFDPYFTTKDTGKGTGIGLYLSKTIIEDTMKGQLIVSNSKEGACFKIIIDI